MTDQVTAEIVKQNDDELKVKWSLGGNMAWKPYKIKLSGLEHWVQQTRHALQSLVSEGLKYAPRCGLEQKYLSLEEEVAKAGYGLYNRLFFGISEEDRQNARRPKEWLAQSPLGSVSVTFLVPSRLHIPWGLIYDHQEYASENGREHFWCMRFSVMTHYWDIPPEWTKPWPAKSFSLLFGAHRDLWDAVKVKVELGATTTLEQTERDRLHKILLYPTQPKFELSELYKNWAEKQDDPHGLLAFYCHSNAGELLLGTETLSAGRFEERFARGELVNEKPPTLVLLAGCQTAVRDLEAGFFEVTSGPGFCGFIGTEVKVPDLFTLRFIIRLICRFYESGNTIGDVMRALRGEHWPVSLVFSPCCIRDLRLTPDGAALPELPAVNLSYELLSSRQNEDARDNYNGSSQA